MFINSDILKILIVLIMSISLNKSEKNCSFWEKYILWHDCSDNSDRNQTLHCTFFQRFVSWDNECSPEPDPPHYSRCTELETFLMKKKFCEYNPDEFLDVPQIIARHGYKSETHEVITQDGYILELHRIPNLNQQAQPIFLQHGLFGSSADWLLNGNDSIAFLLVDHGFDVWMGNSRGNTYSDGHSSYPNHNPLYWNFSFHEMGVNDLDKVIMYIIYVTKLPGELIYIGFSTGAMLGFIYSTTMPISERLIKLIISISPSVYPAHLMSPIKYLAPFIDDSKWVMEHLGSHQFLPNHKILDLLTKQCQFLGIEKIICDNFIFSIYGYSEAEFNVQMLPILLSKMPSGVSTNTICQLAQSIKYGGTFQRFDHGEDTNYKLYGTKRPPKYDLKKIKTPVYIMYSMSDWFSNHTDVLRLANHLLHVVDAHKVEADNFGYLDFLFGKGLLQLVIQPILQTLELFRANNNFDESSEEDDSDYDENYYEEYEEYGKNITNNSSDYSISEDTYEDYY